MSIVLLADNDRREFPDVVAVLQAQLAELGIEVKFRSAEYASMEPDVHSGDFDATLLSRGICWTSRTQRPHRRARHRRPTEKEN